MIRKAAFIAWLALAVLSTGRAATFVWTGGGTDPNWSTPANWSGGIAPANDGTATILLAGTGQLAPNVDTPWNINSLTFSNNAGPFTLGGNPLTIGSHGIVNNGPTLQIINNSITLSANQTWNSASNGLSLTGNIGLGGNTLTISGSFNSLISGVISGAGGLIKNGTGTNTLTAANNYLGATTINTGSLNIQNSSALGNTNASVIIASGTQLQLQGGVNVANPLTLNGSGSAGAGALRNLANDNTWSGVITLNMATTIGCDTNSLTLSGGIINSTNGAATNLLTFSGAGNFFVTAPIGSAPSGLTKLGAGTLYLSASNSYGGPTTVSAGVLNIQNSFGLGSGSGSVAVASGAAVQLQGGVNLVAVALSLNGSGIGGSGVLESVSGSNSWTGPVTLTGSSTINADTGAFNLAGNISNGTSTLTVTNSGTIILAGGMGNGTAGMTKTGTGTLVVNGANSYTGTTTIIGGTLQFGPNGSLPSSAITISSGNTLDLNGFNESILSLSGAGNVTMEGGTLTVNPVSSTTFSGAISGTGGLVQAGTATFTLTGANTYTGGTTITGGSISIQSMSYLGGGSAPLTLNGGGLTIAIPFNSSSPITLGPNGGTLTVSGNMTLSGIISGPGALTKLGGQTLTLTAANTYQGGTTIGVGTLAINSDAALGYSGSPITLSNSTLSFIGSFSSSRPAFLNSGTNYFLVNTGFTNTYSGVISGPAVFDKSGTGFLILTGNNTFTNSAMISAGTLRMGVNGCLSALTPVNVTASGAIFDLNGFNETVGSLAGPGKVTLHNGSLMAGGNNATTTYSGVMSTGGSFTKAGTGTLTFSGLNTYTNITTVGAGTLQLGTSNCLAAGSAMVVSNGAILNLNNFNQTVAALSGAGNVALGAGTLTVRTANTTAFYGNISGTGGLTKAGTGTQILNGASSYSGPTAVNAGALQVNGTASGSTIAATATLSGTGMVATVLVNNGAIESPGAGGPGTLSSGTETWSGGGNYIVDVNNATGAQGGTSGWGWLNISGALNITANPGSPFNINVVSLTSANTSGQVMNFNNTGTYVWTIASASGGITGFNSANFNIITSGFQNSLGLGTFSLSQSGNNLNLIFTSASQANIKDVQSGTITSTGNGTNFAILTAPVNPTTAFLIFNTAHNSSAPGGSMVRGSIVSSNTVQFVRVTTETSTMNIQWYVAEYSTGVRVQRGEVNQTGTVINIPISPISSTNQAFVTWSKTPDPSETIFSDSDPVIGQLTSISNLQFRVTSAPSSVPVISWQVVEFQHPGSISVQQGSVTNMTGTNLLATATLNSPGNLNSTFLLTGYRTSGSGTNIGARMLRAELTSSNTVTFDRSISGAPDNISEISWQAVQLMDGSYVQSGSANLAAGIAGTNVILATSLNTNHAIAFATVQPAGGQNTGRSPSIGTVLGVGSATMAVPGNSLLNLSRNNTSDQTDVGWSVAGLGPSAILSGANGGLAISADTAGGAYTSLTGPAYTEIQNGNVGIGTIVLNAPAGFVFNTNAPLPTVLITQVSGPNPNNNNINNVVSGSSVPLTSVTPSNLVFTVTATSTNGTTCSLTWQGISVRPAAGTPLAFGSIASSGTAALQGVTTNSTSWGFLNEAVGAAKKLALSTAPSSTAVAGVPFAQQPVIQVQDQFGNVRTADNSTLVSVTNTGSSVLQGTLNIQVAAGVATFNDLSYQVAETITLAFNAGGVTGKNSGNILVSPAAANQLAIATQPSTATAGASFPQQPVILIQDQFGNLVTADNSDSVTASLGQGSGTLLGNTTAPAVNGMVTFTNLNYQVAENITINFNSGSLNPATSGNITVSPAAPAQLLIQTQPSAVATAGAPFAQQPVIQVQDQFGNLCSTNNSAVVTATRDSRNGSGTLQGAVSVTAINGVAAFANLANNAVGTISLDFNSATLPTAVSSTILINSAAAAQLVYTTQPGSATVGSIFGTQPALVTEDAYGNKSTSGLAASVPVTIAVSSGTGTLQGTTNLDVGTAAGNGTVAFTNLRLDSGGSKQLTASTSGLTNGVSAIFTVAPANSAVTISTSANPAPVGSNIVFTAAVTPVSPGGGTPTGTVRFCADGSPFGSSVTLTNGIASIAIASLSSGTHTISGQYGGDGNFLGSTNNLSPNEIINGSLVAGNLTIYRNPFLSTKVPLTKLLTNASDAGGITFSLNVSPVSANNATIAVNGGWVFYSPPTGFTNTDSFTYTVTDSYGDSATGVVTTAVQTINSQSQNFTVTDLGNGSSLVNFWGIPARTYSIQYALNLNFPAWQWLGAAAAGQFGQFNFTDTPPTNSPPRFYGSAYP